MVVSIGQLFRGLYRFCYCGCKELIPCVNKRGKFLRFKHGHNQRFNWIYKRFFDNTTKYWYLWIKNHPNSRSNNWIGEHTFFYTEYYQCCILPWGIVHHKDDNKENNMIWNLEGMTRAQHMALHNPKTDKSDRFYKQCNVTISVKSDGYDLWYGNKEDGWLCRKCYARIYWRERKSKYKLMSIQ